MMLISFPKIPRKGTQKLIIVICYPSYRKNDKGILLPTSVQNSRASEGYKTLFPRLIYTANV